MKLLNYIAKIANRNNNNQVSKHIKNISSHYTNHIINGKFKVIPNLNTEMKELDHICSICNQQHKQHQKEYKQSQGLWNECRTGYTNPYTAPIKH